MREDKNHECQVSERCCRWRGQCRGRLQFFLFDELGTSRILDDQFACVKPRHSELRLGSWVELPLNTDDVQQARVEGLLKFDISILERERERDVHGLLGHRFRGGAGRS